MLLRDFCFVHARLYGVFFNCFCVCCFAVVVGCSLFSLFFLGGGGSVVFGCVCAGGGEVLFVVCCSVWLFFFVCFVFSSEIWMAVFELIQFLCWPCCFSAVSAAYVRAEMSCTPNVVVLVELNSQVMQKEREKATSSSRCSCLQNCRHSRKKKAWIVRLVSRSVHLLACVHQHVCLSAWIHNSEVEVCVNCITVRGLRMGRSLGGCGKGMGERRCRCMCVKQALANKQNIECLVFSRLCIWSFTCSVF